MSPPNSTKPAPARERVSKKVTTKGTNNANSTVAQTTDKVNTIFPAAISRAHAPSGRRRMWVSIVEHCPYCGGDHVHRGTAAGPVKGLKAAGCSRRVYYVVPLARKAGKR